MIYIHTFVYPQQLSMSDIIQIYVEEATLGGPIQRLIWMIANGFYAVHECELLVLYLYK